MADTPDRACADRFTTHTGDVTLHRAPGKPFLPDVAKQTTRLASAPPYPPHRRRLSALKAVRNGRQLTQTEVATRMGVGQDEISRLENRDDAKLSTIVGYLESLGATEVDITITFGPDQRERLHLSPAHEPA